MRTRMIDRCDCCEKRFTKPIKLTANELQIYCNRKCYDKDWGIDGRKR